MKKNSVIRKIMLALPFFIFLFNSKVSAQNKFSYAFRDTSLLIEARVKDLVDRLTIKEKVSQLFNESPAIERLGIPAYNWWNECLHGVARAGKATVFPQAIGMAATFDESLLFRIGTAVSDEARAKNNFFLRNQVRSIYTGLTFWSPNINIFRDPRWGRGQETYGEDPFLTGRMGVNFIKGLQGDNPKYFKTIATAKHYAVHSGPEFTRHIDNIFVNDRDLYDTYLPAFKAAVEEANVQSVMCAYNRFRDKPCCGSDLLLSNILRQQFGFSGYVVSDCGAITDFYKPENHHIVQTPSQAMGWSLSAGTDINCEEGRAFLDDHLDSSIAVGMINVKDIDRSVSRLFKARFMLGMFDPAEGVPFTSIPMEVVGSTKHLQLAREAAEKSLVLLKNNGILPLQPGKKIALIGPNADNYNVLIGNYNGVPIHPVTPLAALQKKLGKSQLLYAPGSALIPGVFTNHEIIAGKYLFHFEKGVLKKGLEGEYFLITPARREKKMVRVDQSINFSWEKSPVSDRLEDDFAIKWTGILIPPKTATYQFGGNVTVTINGSAVNSGITLESGKQYAIEVNLEVKAFWWGNTIAPVAQLSWVETSRNFREEALKIARDADLVIFCGGIAPNLEGEEMPLSTEGFAHGDPTHINLPRIQEDLLKEIHQLGKPIVYVNFSGSAIALNWEKENVDAIIQAFYPGEATGDALTNILYGSVNPSGRLPVTFYKSVDDLPAFGNYQMKGRTYRYFAGETLYPFGFGLSYTNFSYGQLTIRDRVSTGDSMHVTVALTNTGTRRGEEVVQVYVQNKKESDAGPLRSLVAIKRVSVQAGETIEVAFTLPSSAFAERNELMQQVVNAGAWVVSIGGRQPDMEAIDTGGVVQLTVEIKGSNDIINR